VYLEADIERPHKLALIDAADEIGLLADHTRFGSPKSSPTATAGHALEPTDPPLSWKCSRPAVDRTWTRDASLAGPVNRNQ
jgi:hypothetical protein